MSAAIVEGRKGRRRPKRISTWVDQETRAESTTRKRERDSVGEEKASGQENVFFPFHFLFWENNIIPQAGKARGGV